MIDINKIVYSETSMDVTDSMRSTAEICCKHKAIPTKIFVINNVFYVYDYIIGDCSSIDEIISVLTNGLL